MREIMIGLRNGLDVSVYADSRFTQQQMRLIRRGLELGLDITGYANVSLTYDEMYEIYLSL